MNREFREAIAAGEEGSVSQGLDRVARIGSELAVDPQTTVGEFVDAIVGSLQGDTHWETASNVGAEATTATVETFETAADVLQSVPGVGTALQGYGEMAAGLGEEGVTGFTGGMLEGGFQLGGEAVDAALGNAAGTTSDYIRSRFR